MTGPVIPGDFACHYTPMVEPRVVAERYMNPPTFRGIDIERHNQVIKAQFTKLSNVQKALLNGITVKVTIRFMGSNLSRFASPKLLFHT